ncbi:hypothetical protein [Ancylobacter radicis]|uniref:HNH endonuclease n=1 Tax=Ancylobacter radicis TaxID=2836179 RepID=A0ABS5R8A6_9HYPH|nr:hypothetical protein [Ancylobacter radicis]MBS9477910.1 hypothetical protein [Ancylobacter radicis]
MGEAAARKSATAQLIAKFPTCAFCCGLRPSSTREHIPPTALFDNGQRPRDIVIPACDDCNRGSSTADLVIALMSRWSINPTGHEDLDHTHLSRRLSKQAPEIITELTRFDGGVQQKKARRHLESQGVTVPPGFKAVSIGPKTIPYINQFCYKLSAGLYFHHINEILKTPGQIWIRWQTKEDLSASGPMHEFISILPEYNSLSQGKWKTNEIFEYKLYAEKEKLIVAFAARLRSALYIYGIATGLPLSRDTSKRWVDAIDLNSIPTTERFSRRF